jgi:hypothetical protein
MKKKKKLGIKKLTLRNLGEPTLDAIAGGNTVTCIGNQTCLPTCATAAGQNTCPFTQCFTCPVRSCAVDCQTLRTCPP